MVLKELPGKKASSEGNPLLTVTTKVGMTTTLVCYLSLLRDSFFVLSILFLFLIVCLNLKPAASCLVSIQTF